VLARVSLLPIRSVGLNLNLASVRADGREGLLLRAFLVSEVLPPRTVLTQRRQDAVESSRPALWLAFGLDILARAAVSKPLLEVDQTGKLKSKGSVVQCIFPFSK